MQSNEIAWSNALVYDIGPASRVTANFPLLVIKLMDIRVRDKPGGARLLWWRRRIRICVAGKGSERGIFARIDPAYSYIYSLYSKGRVELFFLTS